MVREVRFAWGRHQPMPSELINRNWDNGEDDAASDPAPVRRRSRTESPSDAEKKSSPVKKSRRRKP